ncbi:hypothetical protein ACQ4PT_046969 [Festuca glaucescens]
MRRRNSAPSLLRELLPLSTSSQLFPKVKDAAEQQQQRQGTEESLDLCLNQEHPDQQRQQVNSSIRPPIQRSRMERPTRRSLVFLSVLGVWNTAPGLSPTATAAPELVTAPVRVGVVLDLWSEVGRKRRACISMALHDFELRHPSYAKRVELHVMDSRGDAATTAHAAEYLIKNVRAHAIIWGPHTLTKEDHVSHLGRQSHHNHIPVISYSSTSAASCTFWIEDPVKASGGHPKFGFTLFQPGLFSLFH